MEIKERIRHLKTNIRQEIEDILLQLSQQLFDSQPELVSFGWHQYHEDDSVDRMIDLEMSLKFPDVNGNLGEFIQHESDLTVLQTVVANQLKDIPSALLLLAFGDRVDVAIYADGGIELNRER